MINLKSLWEDSTVRQHKINPQRIFFSEDFHLGESYFRAVKYHPKRKTTLAVMRNNRLYSGVCCFYNLLVDSIKRNAYGSRSGTEIDFTGSTTTTFGAHSDGSH